ncbi:hypothetical protein LZP73_19150 [Shewanella sp. AS16]|uniref:hypothetical protein n=1 Tax=Shewanella sp. AS16 TaxID=2907625 RepID=UPI001F465247|nr:hypothetical protein [Shewanella sp. AS16]MCE9688289.1 hypothetical protein [Shewanella sp. AS16]
MNLKSDKKIMYVNPLYYIPAFVFSMFILTAMFSNSEEEIRLSNFFALFLLCTLLTLTLLAIHFLISIPIGKCDITIDRKGIYSDKIKCKRFVGYVDWKSIESVYIFSLGRGPNYIYLYLHSDGCNKKLPVQKIRIPFNFVTESIREIEDHIAQYTKLRKNYL